MERHAFGAAALGSRLVTPDERWLAANWPFVRDNLPAPPARVLEIGCGPLGGFVPELLRVAGCQVVGVDPEAPEEPGYARVEFEGYDGRERVDAIVACTSLHHVLDLGEVLEQATAMLAPNGALVMVEWASERFDEATARWCFERLGTPGDEPGWLHRRQAEWQASGTSWEAFIENWLEQEGLHDGQDILRELDARFDLLLLEYGPYFFPDLNGVTEAEEQAAIDAGLIQSSRIRYVGTPR
jgi:SAM-dependent methyltransferase